jgi:hypothetical protein
MQEKPQEWHVQFPGKGIAVTNAEAIANGLQDGSIVPSQLALQKGMTDWMPLSAIPEFGGTPPPPIPEDPGPFRKIGTTFYLDGQEWVGRTVASPAALYLLKSRSLEGVRIGADLALSLVGTTANLLLRKRPDIRTCTLAEVPPGIRAQLDPKGKRTAGTVAIVRKAAVRFVKVPKIYNVITLRTGGQRVSVVTSWFGVAKAGRWLAGQGWVLNEPLNPSEAPMHGAGFRRGADDAG